MKKKTKKRGYRKGYSNYLYLLAGKRPLYLKLRPDEGERS